VVRLSDYIRVEEELGRVISLRHSKSLVELGLVESIEINQGKVEVKIKAPENCACAYPFFLAALAEKRLTQLDFVESAKVDVLF